MPGYLADLGHSESLIGFYQIIPSLVLILLILISSIRPTGPVKRYFLRIGFFLVASGLFLSMLFPTSISLLITGRLLGGFGYAFGFSFLFALMYEHTDPRKRFMSASVFGISGLLTNAVGASLGEWVYKTAPGFLMFAVPLVFAVTALVLSFCLGKKHDGSTSVTDTFIQTVKKLVKHQYFFRLTFLTLIFGICFAVFWNFLARVTQIRLGSVNIMPFFVMFSVFAVLNRLTLAEVIPKMKYRTVLFFSFTLISVALAGYFMLDSIWQLYVIGAVYAQAHSVLYPFFSSAFVSMAVEDKTFVNNYFLLLFTGGSTGMTQVFAIIADHCGYGPVIISAICLAAAGILISVSLSSRGSEH